ncbi:MAG: glycosyltransferase family 2 protein [bacterium]
MKNKTILLSVIVCTYNRAQLLKNCLRSLEKQTADKKKYEVIVVDNNSTDSTKEIMEDYTKNQTNIRIVTEKNCGRSYARNRGWQEAKGKYVAYIDDDAVAKPDWIEQIMAFIKENPKINAFGGPYSKFSLKPIPTWLPENYFTLNLGNRVKMLNLKNEWLSGSNMIFNRSIFHRYEGFNTNFGGKGYKIIYGEETEFLTRLKKMGESVYYVPKICVKHLVAERKLNLWWLLKNDYLRSFSITLIKKTKFNFLKGAASFILALLFIPLYLIDRKKGIIRRRLYYSLSNIFLSLGQIAGSIYSIINIIAIYFLVFVFFTAIFISFFHTPIFINQKVLFYRGFILLIPAILITSIISALFNYYLFKVKLESLVAAIIISISINLSFFVIFPVTFDRSITMYLLSTLNEKSINQTCDGLSEKALEQYFITEYVKDNFAIKRRIYEQSIINMLKERNSCVQLTQRGRKFIEFSELVKRIYLVK